MNVSLIDGYTSLNGSYNISVLLVPPNGRTTDVVFVVGSGV